MSVLVKVLVVVVSLLYIFTSCAVTETAQDTTVKSSQNIQIRVYADAVVFPCGHHGGAIYIYGMRVQPDGSEKVVWRRVVCQDKHNEIFRPSAGVASHTFGEVRILYSDGVVYVGLDYRVYKLQRETGRLLKVFRHIDIGSKSYDEIADVLCLEEKMVGIEDTAVVLRPMPTTVPRIHSRLTRVDHESADTAETPTVSFELADIDSIQIRLYADRNTHLPSGRTGTALYLYGMKVMPDGSEKTVWRILLASSVEKPRWKDGDVRVLLYSMKTLYVEYRNRVLKIERDTGRILSTLATESKLYTRMKEAYELYVPSIISRPIK